VARWGALFIILDATIHSLECRVVIIGSVQPACYDRLLHRITIHTKDGFSQIIEENFTCALAINGSWSLSMGIRSTASSTDVEKRMTCTVLFSSAHSSYSSIFDVGIMDQDRDDVPVHCCSNCGKVAGGGGITLKACKSCMSVKYCNAKCQTKHWSRHKKGYPDFSFHCKNVLNLEHRH
jgi:hypothetical protein